MLKCIPAHRDLFMVPQSPLPEAVPLLDQAIVCQSHRLTNTIPVRGLLSQLPSVQRFGAGRPFLSPGFSQTNGAQKAS